jgi:hypothetical protein
VDVAGTMNDVSLTVRFVLAFLLLAAAGPKIADGGRFRRSVAGYGVLPAWLVGPTATAIPWIEAGSAVALFGGLGVGLVATIDGLLFLMFSAAATLNLRKGRRIDCGCFGSVASRAIGWDLIALDVACSLMAGFVVVSSRWPWTSGGSRPSAHAPWPTSASVPAALLAGTLVAAYLLIESWRTVRPALAKLPADADGRVA